MRGMATPRIRLLTAAAIAFALAVPLSGRNQDASALQGSEPPPNGVWVDSLDLSKTAIRRPRAQRGQATPAAPLTYKLAGASYAHALPLVSDGDVTIDLAGAATRFVAMVGVDDGAPPQPGRADAPPPPPPPAGSVVFGAWVDGRKAFESEIMRRGDAPKMVSVDLTGAKTLVLAVVDANDGTAGDNADWAGAAIVTAPGQQARISVAAPSVEQPPAIAASRTAAPMINYPRITGATPG